MNNLMINNHLTDDIKTFRPFASFSYYDDQKESKIRNEQYMMKGNNNLLYLLRLGSPSFKNAMLFSTAIKALLTRIDLIFDASKESFFDFQNYMVKYHPEKSNIDVKNNEKIIKEDLSFLQKNKIEICEIINNMSSNINSIENDFIIPTQNFNLIELGKWVEKTNNYYIQHKKDIKNIKFLVEATSPNYKLSLIEIESNFYYNFNLRKINIFEDALYHDIHLEKILMLISNKNTLKENKLSKSIIPIHPYSFNKKQISMNRISKIVKKDLHSLHKIFKLYEFFGENLGFDSNISYEENIDPNNSLKNVMNKVEDFREKYNNIFLNNTQIDFISGNGYEQQEDIWRKTFHVFDEFQTYIESIPQLKDTFLEEKELSVYANRKFVPIKQRREIFNTYKRESKLMAKLTKFDDLIKKDIKKKTKI